MNDALFTICAATAAGVLLLSIATRLHVPSIVFWLMGGVLVGPEVANVIDPEALGPGLKLVVGLSVAVILFEGGLTTIAVVDDEKRHDAGDEQRGSSGGEGFQQHQVKSSLGGLIGVRARAPGARSIQTHLPPVGDPTKTQVEGPRRLDKTPREARCRWSG